MKKIITVFALVLVMSVSTIGLQADSKYTLENLYSFDELSDGTLGYNKDRPVMFYEGSEEQVKVPKEFIQDKRQMKSAWIATIFNINIPTPKSEEEFKELYMERLNDFVDWNMNAMIFQIRPLLDAYYPSKINPTSEYLSGKQGVDVDYDPLEWMIEETHKAGLEYHAWLNPYRVTNSLAESLLPKGTLTTEQMNEMPIEDYIDLLVEHGVLSEDNFAVKNPEYVIRFGGKLILNPGHPEVRQHVVDTVEELITNYDLDAIHFDDYFYPYGTDNKKDKKEEVKEEVKDETKETEETQEETNEKFDEKENLVEEKTKDEVDGVSEENQDVNEIESEDSKSLDEEVDKQDKNDEQKEGPESEVSEDKEVEIDKEVEEEKVEEKEEEKEVPKPVEDFDLQDREEFEKYGIANGYEDTEEGLEQWRRDNVTSLIKDLNKTIRDHNKKNKKAVQLGISPFGIWEHKGNHPDGSNTPLNSTSTYSKSIFADTKAWIDQELIDYIAPQIYWSFDTKAAPYGELARWWNNAVKGKNVKLYIGHPNYKYIEGWKPGKEFLNPEEINNQVKFNQLYENISGSILFSYRNMRPDNLEEIAPEKKAEHAAMNESIKILKNDTFSKLPLTPEMPWLSTGDVKAVENIAIKDSDLIIDDKINDNARYYMIYRGTSDQSDEEIVSDINNLDGKILSKGKAVYTHPIEKLNSGDKFVVTVVDRASVETEGVSVTHLVKEEPVVDKKPSEDKKPNEEIKDNTNEGNSELPATGMSPIMLTTGITTVGLGSLALILSKRKRK